MAERRVAPEWLRTQRWFAGKNRAIRGISTLDELPWEWRLITVTYEDGTDELYSLPPDSCDFHRRIIEAFASAASRVGGQSTLQFETFLDIDGGGAEPRILTGEQSNTSVAYGDQWMLKLFRRLSPGRSRDLEVGHFLTSEARFPYTPAVAGAISYGDDMTLAVLQRFVPNVGDAWSYVLSHLQETPQAPDDVYWSEAGLPGRGDVMADIEELGRITGAMHHALASRPDIAAFAPEPATMRDAEAWVADMRFQLAAAGAALDDVATYDRAIDRLARDVRPEQVMKIQIHGDYHLGQVLKTEDSFAIIDFEGEPARPLVERRAKQSPLRDVAGMLRSLHYASSSAPFSAGAGEDSQRWYHAASEAFLEGWSASAGEQFSAGSAAATQRLIGLFQLAKALYELNYELNNRPDWVHIPLRGIRELVERL